MVHHVHYPVILASRSPICLVLHNLRDITDPDFSFLYHSPYVFKSAMLPIYANTLIPSVLKSTSEPLYSLVLTTAPPQSQLSRFQEVQNSDTHCYICPKKHQPHTPSSHIPSGSNIIQNLPLCYAQLSTDSSVCLLSLIPATLPLPTYCI